MGLHNCVCSSIYSRLPKKQELSETPIIWESKERTDNSRGGGLYQREDWAIKQVITSTGEWKSKLSGRKEGEQWFQLCTWETNGLCTEYCQHSEIKLVLGIVNKKCETYHWLYILNTISIPGTFSSRRGCSKVGEGTIKSIECFCSTGEKKQAN